MRAFGATKLSKWAISIFSFVPRAPGLLISEKTPMAHQKRVVMVQSSCRLTLCRSRLLASEDLLEELLHVRPRALVRGLAVLQGIHTHLVRIRVREAVFGSAVENHLPIQA